MDIRELIGIRIAELRKNAGFTQEKIKSGKQSGKKDTRVSQPGKEVI